jgi:hydroxymethylglutaryl-CoA synthase
MAICPPGFGVVDLAAEAARRALGRWEGDRSKIGLIAIGTESAVDMSRPMSAYVAERLGLSGGIRSYEVKHACYGGTLALRQATEWRMSGVGGDRAALVVAADVALYEEGDPGEATQGAGAVAFVVDQPSIAAIERETYAYSEPGFDFWRPVGDQFPTVNGKLSLDCYKKAAEFCFRALLNERDPEKALQMFSAICFHVPFPKMVRKAVLRLGEAFGLTPRRSSTCSSARSSPPCCGTSSPATPTPRACGSRWRTRCRGCRRASGSRRSPMARASAPSCCRWSPAPRPPAAIGRLS